MVNDSIYAVDENTTYPYLNDTDYYSEPLIYAITFYGTLSMFILGIILNLVTIFAIGLGRNIGKEVKVQLINLAVADLFMCVTSLVIAIMYLSMDISYVSHFDLVPEVFASWSMYISPLCNAAISVERMFIVYFPLRAHRYTQTHKYIAIVLLWLFSAFCGSVAVFVPGLSLPAFGSFVLMTHAIICITVVTCYTLVVIKLCLRKRRSLNSHTSRQQHDSITKLQVMVMVDAILTVVTWMPYTTYIFIINIPHFLYISSLAYPLVTLLYTNTFSTPVVYFVFNRYFREDVKLLFIRIFCRRNSSPQNNNEQIIQQQIQLQPMTPSREV